MELQDKTFNFEDNIWLVVLKIIVWKHNLSSWKEYLKIWMLGMELRDKRFHFEDNIGLLVFKMILLKN